MEIMKMYYPILRGKQHEFSALKELALLNKFEKVTPVIEPVNKNLRDLIISIRKLNEKHIKPILIINPNIGEYKGNPFLFYKTLQLEKTDLKYTPCINMNNPEATYFLNNIDNYALFFDDYYEIGDLAKKATLTFLPHNINKDSITHINNVVLYGDFFPKNKRNADYPNESYLTDLNTNFRSAHNIIGYADFTITPKKYSNNGGPAYVVAIHATYTDLKRENHKYMKHYLSFDNNSTNDVGGKFFDALNKLLNDVDNKKVSYSRTSALDDFRYFRDKPHYPGLGIAKKISIKHHIETINDFLK